MNSAAPARPLAPSTPPAPPAPSPLPRLLRTALQVFGLIAFWYGADRAATALGLPFSGGVLGLFVLVALLLGKAVRPAAVEDGAEWLLSNMLLFFIPLVVSVVQFTGLLKSDGLRLFAAIAIGFISVLLASALTVEWVCRIARGRRLRRLRQMRRPRAMAATRARP